MISLYIHIPFCVRKCSYCDFLSGFDYKYTQDYTAALIREISAFKTEEKVGTIFIGGGTPSSVDVKYIDNILNAAVKNFSLEKDCEISMESNPGTLTDMSLAAYRAMGINRLSMGVQSFDDGILKILGRIHDARTARESILLAKKYFDNINLDLMFALPSQTERDWQKTLECTAGFEPTHISAYSLIIEEGTPFYDRYSPADDDTDRNMYHYAQKYLADKGYKQYEISNFARDGFACRHNLVYWQGGDYKGFGLGAASLVNAHRTKNTQDMRAYLDGVTVEEDILLDEDDMMKEFVILGLRCTDGIDSRDFYARFKRDIYDVFGNAFDRHKDLLEIRDTNIRFSERGLDLSNILFVDIL